MNIIRTFIFILLAALFLIPLGHSLFVGIQESIHHNPWDWKGMDFFFIFVMIGGGLLNVLFLIFLFKIIANPKAGGFVRTFAFLILLPILVALGAVMVAVVGSWMK